MGAELSARRPGSFPPAKSVVFAGCSCGRGGFMTTSFNARTTLSSGGRTYDIWSLAALPKEKVARLPYSLKILLENLLRFEDGVNVTRADIDALLNWDPP